MTAILWALAVCGVLLAMLTVAGAVTERKIEHPYRADIPSWWWAC